MDHSTDNAFRNSKLKWLFLIQLLLVLLIPLLFFHIQQQQIAHDELLQLRILTQQKSDQIESWLNERVGDAQVLENNPLFINMAVQLNRDPHYPASEIEETFAQLQRRMAYESLTVFDQKNRPRLVLGNAPVKKLNETSTPTNAHNITTDWFRDADGALHMGIRIPLRDPNSFFVIGALQLTQAVATALLPKIETWPSSTTGFTLLLQPYDERVLAIHVPANNALGADIKDIPYPQQHNSLLAKALSDQSATLTVKDERQHDVFASYQPVAYTGWHVLLQKDQKEAYAPLYNQLIWLTLGLLFVDILLMLLLYMQWRQQQYRNALVLRQKTAEKDRLLRHFFELPLFGMAITHAQTGRWLRFNNQLCELVGYSREEMNQVEFTALLSPEDRESELPLIRQMELDLSDGFQRERQIQHKDGSFLHVLIDTHCVREENRRISFIVRVVEDISRRKASELELKKKNLLYNMLSHTNQAIVHCPSREILFERVCQIAVEDGGFSLAMIAQCTPEQDDVNIIHTFGDNSGFTDWITEQKRKDPTLLSRTGAMHAIAQQKNIILNDYLHETLTSPFHAIAEAAQVLSAGYYLIYEGGKLFGVLGLYAKEKDFFTETIQNTLTEVASDISFALDNFNRDQQLVASERLFHNLATFVHVGIFRLDPYGNLLYINEFGAELLQMPSQSQTALWLNALNNDDYRKIYQEWLPHLFSHGESEMECRLPLKNHKHKDSWLIIHARSETNEQNQIIGYIGTLTDIRKIKETEARLKHQAHYDPLTGLPNRILLNINLKNAIQSGSVNRKRVALLIVDLDRFKDVNDSFGHPIGDVLLQEVAHRLQQHLQMPDKISRLGGDEFAILLDDNPPPEYINAIATNVILLMKKAFRLPNDRDVMLGASIGISLYPDHGTAPQELLQKADAAMYFAKENGRNCFKYFSSELTGLAEQRLDMEFRLKQALDRNELRVYFQPQVEINSGRIIGAEALVRWQDPKHGLISPVHFIPIAEETGLIQQIGEWVLTETCRQGQRWREEGLPDLTLAVNISPVQFHYSDIYSIVSRALTDTGFPANKLELELTESILMSREEEAIDILSQLQAKGIKLAIDDFGTGYSSLSYLKCFPLDVLKIDKSFVDDIPHKKDDMEIAATIVAIAHTLRLKVMAEGVENMEQLNFLKEQGCDCYQGYLMSPPLPADEFAQLLQQHSKPTT
ncbi:sensor domain-containing protein [Tolumonas lignilytica]|uniref:sensor domain-containing protein n=1 Tax=Tolumonas lignilytica TaxID=1283284 RepID=UPI000464E24A|nr:EAL domain-containing protein [Tolumonas lignilytica]